MCETTNVFSIIKGYVKTLFEETTFKDVPIRRLGISFNVVGEGSEGYNLFTDYDKVEKEKKGEMAILDIKSKFGKNAIIRGMDLSEGATAQIRNKLVGGHNGE